MHGNVLSKLPLLVRFQSVFNRDDNMPRCLALLLFLVTLGHNQFSCLRPRAEVDTQIDPTKDSSFFSQLPKRSDRLDTEIIEFDLVPEVDKALYDLDYMVVLRVTQVLRPSFFATSSTTTTQFPTGLL